MAKWLRVVPDMTASGDLTGANYRLPGSTDLKSLADEIAGAMTKGEGLVVEVEKGDTPLSNFYVVINGKAAHSVYVAETPEADDDLAPEPGLQVAPEVDG